VDVERGLREVAREALPRGMSFVLDGGGALTLVRETGRPAPVLVEGSVWGPLGEGTTVRAGFPALRLTGQRM
jgi:hypothetical protein